MLAAAEVESGSPLWSSGKREQLEAYRATHDLAEAVQGAVMPPLWIVRDGNSGWAASTGATARAPFSELLGVLRSLGDYIESRLSGVSDSVSDRRSREAVRAWRARADHGRMEVIEAATGYPREAATGYPRELVAQVESVFYSDDERDWAELRSDELLAAARAAARLVGPQPRATLRPILEAVRGVRRRDCSELNRVSEEALAVIAGMHDEPPYMQGHELAHELRSKPGVTGSSGRVDPVMVLESLSVPLVNPDYSCFPPHRRTSGHVNVMNCGRPLVTRVVSVTPRQDRSCRKSGSRFRSQDSCSGHRTNPRSMNNRPLNPDSSCFQSTPTYIGTSTS